MRTLIIIALFSIPLNAISQYGSIKSGQKLPEQEIHNDGCKDNCPSAVRLLGYEPHVPFAIIDHDTIFSAGQKCCTEWASTKDEWFNLNEWGEIVGRSRIKYGDGYDATQCFELQMQTTTGKDGVGFYTSKMVDWKVRDDLKWNPSGEEIQKFMHFISTMDSVLIDITQQNFVESDYQGEMFAFKIKPDNDTFDTLKCIVFGRRYLVIAYLNKNNEWVLAHLINRETNDPFKTFKPLALIDCDNDGIPEILYQESFGYAFWDIILKLERGYYIDNWKDVAQSVGGATV